MKGVCADCTQEADATSVFCTHSGLPRNGIVHGFLAADEMYVPFRSTHHRFFLFLTGARFAQP